MPRIVVVSNRLPVTLHTDREPPHDVEQSSGGLASAFRSVAESYETLVWIGWPGAVVDGKDEEQKFTKRLEEVSATSTIECIPVWLSQREVEDFYNGFSNSSLWPVLHWMTNYARFKGQWFDTYKKVNERFADEVIRIANITDLIWVQDYHLFLVPQLIRQRAAHAGRHVWRDPSSSPVLEPVERPDHLPEVAPEEEFFLDEAPQASETVTVTEEEEELQRPKHLPKDLRALRPLSFAEPSPGSPKVTSFEGLDRETFAPPKRTTSGLSRTSEATGDGSKLKVAFFLHTPFPSYEIMLVHPNCQEILEGILGADLVGFHTYGYLRHFRSAVVRICGFLTEMDRVDHEGQRTMLGVFPIGVNWSGPGGISEAMQTDKFAGHLAEYTQEYEGKQLVLSVERLDYSKGLPQKLAAIRKYLENAQRAKEEREAHEKDKELEHKSGEEIGELTAPEDWAQESSAALQRKIDDKIRTPTRKSLEKTVFGPIRRLPQAISKAIAKTNPFSSAQGDEAQPQWDQTKTVFLFVAVPSRQEVTEYILIEQEVHRIISEINGRFSTPTHQPIIYIHRSIKMEELSALYARADCCLTTPLIDGMNLVAKEYLAAKDRAVGNVVPGTIVLSELAGAAQELFDAIVVNPYHEEAVAQAIAGGLSLSYDQRWMVCDEMRQTVIENDAVAWGRGMIDKLQEDIPPDMPGTHSHGPRKTVSTLKQGKEARKFCKGSPGQKALFLDYDGTLSEIVERPEDALPTEDARKLFEALDAREDLSVFIVSGRDQQFLDANFGEYRNFELIAEHGYEVRKPRQAEWRLFNPHTLTNWKDKVKPMMQLYARTTPHSRVEEKSCALVWHFRKCDEDYGAFKAKELVHLLSQSLTNLPCQVSRGNMIVEVSSLQVKKGLVVRGACIARRETSTPFSRVLCIGDDKTDESMFLEALSKDVPEALTVKVGHAETIARKRLDSPAEVRSFLWKIATLERDPEELAGSAQSLHSPDTAGTSSRQCRSQCFMSAVEHPYRDAESGSEGSEVSFGLQEHETEGG